MNPQIWTQSGIQGPHLGGITIVTNFFKVLDIFYVYDYSFSDF